MLRRHLLRRVPPEGLHVLPGLCTPATMAYGTCLCRRAVCSLHMYLWCLSTIHHRSCLFLPGMCPYFRRRQVNCKGDPDKLGPCNFSWSDRTKRRFNGSGDAAFTFHCSTDFTNRSPSPQPAPPPLQGDPRLPRCRPANPLHPLHRVPQRALRVPQGHVHLQRRNSM